jgi:hypothetical protein
MRHLLFLSLVMSCDVPTPTTYPKKEQVVIVKKASFVYKDKECSIMSVHTKPIDCNGCYWTEEVRFVDCGDGIIPAQFVNGKAGLK